MRYCEVHAGRPGHEQLIALSLPRKATHCLKVPQFRTWEARTSFVPCNGRICGSSYRGFWDVGAWPGILSQDNLNRWKWHRSIPKNQ
jgi:hypothetical protein